MIGHKEFRRRKFLSGAGSCLLVGLIPSVSYADKASTYFSLKWRGLNVGFSKIDLSKKGNTLTADIGVKISVKILNFDAFSYKLQNQEVWQSGTLRQLKSETMVGNKKNFVSVQKISGGFKIEGSKFDGIIKGNPATTSYFTPDFLKRKTWISTQDGDPLKINTKKIGADFARGINGDIPATLWEVSGDLDLKLLYSEKNEWVGSRFQAGGSQAEFILEKSTGNMHSLWKSS